MNNADMPAIPKYIYKEEGNLVRVYKRRKFLWFTWDSYQGLFRDRWEFLRLKGEPND